MRSRVLSVKRAKSGRPNDPHGRLPAARFATHAGALAVTRLGVIPALPAYAEVEALPARRPFTSALIAHRFPV